VPPVGLFVKDFSVVDDSSRTASETDAGSNVTAGPDADG
jgi:hypothetical protein